MLALPIRRYSRRQINNVLLVTGDEQFRSTILMLKMLESSTHASFSTWEKLLVRGRELEDHRKSTDSTPRCPTALFPEATMKVAAKETSGKAPARQASSGLPVSSLGERQDQKDHYHLDAKYSVKGKDGKSEVESASDREHQASGPPNSLFPWPKPRFRERHYLFEPSTESCLPTMRSRTAAQGEAMVRGCV